ncbi:hypothetical protein EDD29_5736 [Actinocorallia herbida]|uniref:MobA/VirD2-like nuclease domain-containing protein n=1 Tax=Actinocorallia herbida TaxID=58109 RepID=A0A3N1D3J5_9ACTN|nr:hypothetical protein [Actinocorallia herbida]ROO88079.1 hypothetical protein EDD29_5736 [Actinocorallia herbida]
MIGKVLRGQRVGGLLRYLFGPGARGEHEDPRIVAGFGETAELEPALSSLGRRDFRKLEALMSQPLSLLDPLGGVNRPVWHYPIRAHPDDPVLTDEQWAEIAREVVHAVGYARRDDEGGCRWFAVRHADDHIHLVVTLARQDGTRPEVRNDALRGRQALLRIERRLGLVRTAPADRTAARRATRGEMEKAGRVGRSEPSRDTLRRVVTTCAARARSEAEFFELLRGEGLVVKTRESRVQPGEITGYAVGLAGDVAAGGASVCFGGGRLASDLTLPRLRRRWPSGAVRADPRDPDRSAVWGESLSLPTVRAVLRRTLRECAEGAASLDEFFSRVEQAGMLLKVRYSERVPGQVTGYSVALPGDLEPPGSIRWHGAARIDPSLSPSRLAEARRSEAPMTHEELQGIYDDAARAASAAAERIRNLVGVDPKAAHDAARAVSDVLHVASWATGNHHLRRAADDFDRAARPPNAVVPRPSPAGRRLRTSARLLSLGGLVGNRTTLDVLALAVALSRATREVGVLRASEGRHAQASAAYRCAAHLDELVPGAKARRVASFSAERTASRVSPDVAGRRRPRRG